MTSTQHPTFKSNPKAFCAYVDAGMTLFPCVGYSKVPRNKGFLDLPFDLDFTPNDHNYGVLLRRRYLVIDCDPRQYEPGDKPLSRLFNELELSLELVQDTFVVRTPRGGVHVYFKKSDSVAIKHRLKEYPGLEFKDQFIMACGSYITKTPKGEAVEAPYKASYHSPARIQKAPHVLLAKILKEDRPLPTLDAEVTPDQPADIKSFIRHCQIVQPAVEGQNGDMRTYQVACAGRDFGLSPQKVFDIVWEHYNPRCDPAWEQAELQIKISNAYEYSTRGPAGIMSVQNLFSSPIQQPKTTDIKVKYHMTALGQLKKSMHNLQMMFEYPFMQEKRELKIPAIGNLLRFDQFAHTIQWGRPAPWFKASQEWDDEDAIMFKSILSEQLGIDFALDLIHQVAHVCSCKRAFHPVRDYLEGCKWDGINRVNGWLSRYCGALDNVYTRFVGRKVLAAAVARVFAPGCKFDHVLVTEGAQGIGKSYMWEILTSPWFTDAPLHIQDRSAIEVMRGKWVVELAEMDALGKYESRTIKGFLSRNEDRTRMVYERKTKNFPRQNIFVGSINPEVTGWLKDRTGNRRYWPVAVSKIALDALKKDREALWAEALQIFRAGEHLYVPDSMLSTMNKEVSSRMQEDPWFELIEEHLREHVEDYRQKNEVIIIPSELYMRCIGGSAATFKMPEANRMASILKILGFTKRRNTARLGYVYTKDYVESL